jgi:hypothetical protein
MTIKMVPWAFPKEGDIEIENIAAERQEAVAGGVRRGETLPELPPVGSTPLWHVHHHLKQHHLDTPLVISWQT